jgi:hypothetical protein
MFKLITVVMSIFCLVNISFATNLEIAPESLFTQYGLTPVVVPGGSVHKGKIISIKKSLGFTYYEIQEDGKKIWADIGFPDQTMNVGDEIVFATTQPAEFKSLIYNRAFYPFYSGLTSKVLNKVSTANQQEPQNDNNNNFIDNIFTTCPSPEEVASGWGNRKLENIGAICKEKGMSAKNAIKWLKEYSRLNKLIGDESHQLVLTFRPDAKTEKNNIYIESFYYFLRGWNGNILNNVNWEADCGDYNCTYSYPGVGITFNSAENGNLKYRINSIKTEFPFDKKLSSLSKKYKINVKNTSTAELLKRTALVHLNAGGDIFFMTDFCREYFNEDENDKSSKEIYHSDIAFGYDVLRNGLSKDDELTLVFIKEILEYNGRPIKGDHTGRFYGWDPTLIARNKCDANKEEITKNINNQKESEKK